MYYYLSFFEVGGAWKRCFVVRVGRVGIFRYHSNEGGIIRYPTSEGEGQNLLIPSCIGYTVECFGVASYHLNFFLRTSVVINALFFVFLQKRWTIKRIHG